MKQTDLSERLAALPELYQPVFGHPELSAAAQRRGADRLAPVLAVHDALRDAFARPLRVLDLGCAQGYFSLYLAARGAQVTAVDADASSIALARDLAAEHAGLAIRFEVARVETVLADLEPDAYDLILGLSVLHHVIHSEGIATVRAWLAQVAASVPVALFELALREESLPWAAALPGDPRALLEDYAFVHEMGRFPTHLSPVARPLLIASNRYWVLPPGAGPIDAHFDQSHALAKDHYRGSRRYFRSRDRLIKLFRYDVEPALDNPGELAREVAFLSSPPAGFAVPALHDWGETATSGWLIREWWPGRLLLDCLDQATPLDAGAVVLEVLFQLARLEDAGLYHDDLRIWNLLRRDDGRIALIDYGSITAEPVDRAWPGSPYLAVFILIHELVTGEVVHPEPLRPAAISPWGLPAPFRRWAAELWNTPLERWRFADLHARLAAVLAAPPDPERPLRPPQRWAADIERAIDIHGRFLSYLHWRHDRYTDHVAAVEARAWESEAHARASEAQARASEAYAHAAENRAQAAEAAAQAAEARAQAAEARAEELQAQLAGREARIRALVAYEATLRASTSWRLTAPLRAVKEGVLRLRRAARRPRPAASPSAVPGLPNHPACADDQLPPPVALTRRALRRSLWSAGPQDTTDQDRH